MHSACSMCLAAPMKVQVDKGRIIEIRGEDIPGWEGVLCGKAIAGIGGRIYAPDRILYPLKRLGKRGEGEFVRCSWQEVIEALSSKLSEYIAAGHPEYFEIWWGCPLQQDNMYFIHYWSAVIQSGISYMHGQACFGDQVVEKIVTFGTNHAPGLIHGVGDWLHMKYAVIAGQNFPGTSAGGGTPCNVTLPPLLNKARENGCKFIVIDPKLTDSASWCDEWIPISPGSDTIFVLAICNVLLRENLYDVDFLLRYTNAAQLIKDNGQALKDKEGHYLAWHEDAHSPIPLPEAGEINGSTLGLDKTFDVSVDGDTVKCKTAFQLLSELIGKYTPQMTDFPDKTVEIARNLGSYRPSVILFPGFTSGKYPNEFQTRRAYSIANLLLGNLDKPGGFYFGKNQFDLGDGWPEPPEVPEYLKHLELAPGPFGNSMSIHSIDKSPCYKKPREFHPHTQALPWLHFEAIKQGKIKALLSTAENSAITQTNTKWVEECLRNLDLIVVGDQVPKEFVDLADYVIPEASYLERYHLYADPSYLGVDNKEHAVVYMRSAAIPPQGESKPLSWFLVQVANRIGFREYFEKLDLEFEWWDRMLKKAGLYPKVSSKKLVEDGPYHEEHPMMYNVLFKPIDTRSGRFEVYSNELAEECYYNSKSLWHRNLHVYPLPVFIPIAKPKANNEFHLLSGKASWHQKSATQNNRYLMEDALEGDCPYTAIYLNAERAKRMDLKTGDLVEVECVGPTKEDDSCVHNEAALGNKERARLKVTETIHPEVAWIYFAGGHKSKSLLAKARQGITMNWLVPSSVSPYAAAVGKNYSIVKVHKVDEGK